MSSKVDQLPFQVGKTYYNGNTIDANNLKGDEILGKVYEIEDVDYSDTATVRPNRTNVRRKLMAVRNTSGATLHRKRLATMSLAAGKTTKEIVGYNTDYSMAGAFPIDEHLSANGVPANDICYVVVEGPAECTMPASEVADVAIGDYVGAMTGSTTAATTSGRVVKIDTAATTHVAGALLNIVGRAMSAISSSQVAADILVNIRPH